MRKEPTPCGSHKLLNIGIRKKSKDFHYSCHIRNFKSWLRGVHHKCSNNSLQCYLDEFHFSFNRIFFLDTILNKLFEEPMANNAIPTKSLDANQLLNPINIILNSFLIENTIGIIDN